jgi:hypothetical protein
VFLRWTVRVKTDKLDKAQTWLKSGRLNKEIGMSGSNPEFERYFAHEGATADSTQALDKIYNDLRALRGDVGTVNHEFNNIQCDPPAPPQIPAPQCHELPPNSSNVDAAVQDMGNAKEEILKKTLVIESCDKDRAAYDKVGPNKPLTHDLVTMRKQAEGLGADIQKLYSSTYGKGQYDYDRDVVMSASDAVYKDAKEMKKTADLIKKDLGSK